MFLQVLPMVFALAFLMFFSFKKVNIIFLSIASALLLALLSRQPIYEALTDTYMTGAASYLKSYFLLFFSSVIFGKLMELSGAASSIAAAVSKVFKKEFAILGIVIACAVLVYGGISGLVVAFAMYPIALSICQRADIPCYLIPGAIVSGAFTFTTACLPGAPSISNATCSSVFGTTAMAAPLLGILCGIFCLTLSSVYLIWEQKRAHKLDKHFVVDAASLKILEKSNAAGERVKPIVAILPPVGVVIALNVFKLPTLEKLASLPPAFREDGNVTAGNASGTGDGASFIVLMSAEKAKKLNITPIARFLGFAVAGVDPRYMGIGPMKAVPKLMELLEMSTQMFDVIELNEAFAAQAIPCMRELDLDEAKVNPRGGAVAMGHPRGATGAILLCKALSYLEDTKGRYGLITMCIGGGMGAAGAIEMI